MIISHWILENLYEIHCNSCGYISRDVVFLLEDNDIISTIYPEECEYCRSKMAYLDIKGSYNESALKEILKSNGGFYKF